MSFPSLRDRGLPAFGAGLLAGAAVVVAAWLLGGRTGDTLVDDPGIPPPEYAYLDNARVLAYLAQIEGGLSTSEKRTRQVASSGTGGVSAAGVQVGAARSREEFVEQVVTPTATTRFYRLLDRLGAKGYLRELDAAAAPATLRSSLRPVEEGEFVRLRRCRLWMPTYADLLGLIRRSRGTVTAADVFGGVGGSTQRLAEAAVLARAAANPERGSVGTGVIALPPRLERAWPAAARRYAAAVPANPPTAFASCHGTPTPKPRGVDLLISVPLASLSGVDSLLAGPVTVVGKVVRRVRSDADVYVDAASYTAYSTAVEAFQAAIGLDEPPLATELATDVTVLAPGVVLLPVAIYK